MTTLHFNGTPQDLKLLLGISKKIGIDLKVVKEKKRTLNKEQEGFKNRMRNNLKQIEMLKKGELKTQPLENLLKTL